MDLTSTFDDVLLTDAGTTQYGAYNPNQTSNDMIATLLTNGDDPDHDPGEESSPNFSEDVTRIYFEMAGSVSAPKV